MAISLRSITGFLLLMYGLSVSCEQILVLDLPGVGKTSIAKVTSFCFFLLSGWFVLSRGRFSSGLMGVSVGLFLFLFGLFLSGVSSGEGSPAKLITYIALIVTFFMILQLGMERVFIDRLLGCYAIGGLITAVGTILGVLYFPSWLTPDSGYGRNSAFGFDKNDMAMIINISMLSLCVYLQGRMKAFFLAVSLVACYAIILSASKTGIVFFLINMVFIGVYLSNGKIYLVPFIGIIISFLLVGLFSSGVVPEYSLERFGTIYDSVANGELTGREQLWGASFRYLYEHPVSLLLGIGPGNFIEIVALKLGMNPHNVFLSILFDSGAVGFFAFCYLIYRSFMGFLIGRGILFKAIAFNLLVSMFMLNWEIAKTLWLFMAIGILMRVEYEYRGWRGRTDFN